jgi:hypothetical protein
VQFIKAPTQQAPTRQSSPIRLKALQREEEARRKRQRDLEDLPTQHVPVPELHTPAFDVRELRLSLPQKLSTGSSGLSLDEQGRPYLKIVSSGEPTTALTEQAIHEFYQQQHCYPVELVLNFERYAFFGEQAEYYPYIGMRIPYRYEGDLGYDIMARGDIWTI